MRHALIGLWMFIASATAAFAQVSIGINVSLFPELVRVPGYPVYYAPQMSSNFFFYDGMYWVYQGDEWYASSWYNGPWDRIQPHAVPLFVLRVPVSYYRNPPPYFRQWRASAPPRWGDHWGRDWEQRHRGWDRWDRRSAPPPAPLPRYQRQYSGDRYPDMNRQHDIQNRNYRYQPRDAATRSQTRERDDRRQETQRARVASPQSVGQPARRESVQRSAPPAPRPAVVAPAPAPQRAPAVQENRERNQRAAPPERESRETRQEGAAPRGQPSAEQPRRGEGRERTQGRERDGEREQGRGR